MRVLRAATILVLLAAAAALAADSATGVSEREADRTANRLESPGAGSLLLTFVGDIMHHDTNAQMPDYDRLYDAVRGHLLGDDLSFANIEFPVDPGREPSGYPLFNGTPEYVEAAIRAGFDVFSLANNHSFDWGDSAAEATGRHFASLAASTGTYHNGLRALPGDAIRPTVIEHDGWTIGFVAITTFSNVSGSAPFINLVDYSDGPARGAFLEQVAFWDTEFDLLIVSVHSGTEYVSRPDPEKAQFFRDLVSHGVDIVWGHHPHVLQPWETVHAGTANKLIMHSTGNFISGQRRLQQPFLPLGRWAPTGDTALFRVSVTRSSVADRTGRYQPTVTRVVTPILTAHDDPTHGLVPRTFGTVLTEPLPLIWRAFYATRYAATRTFLNAPLASIEIRPVH